MDTSTREATALNRAVAAQIRAILAGRNMKQAALAARMGVTEVWLSRRLREVQPLSLDDVEGICRALGVEPSVLVASAVKGTWQPTVPRVTRAVRPPDGRPKNRPGVGSANGRTRQKRDLTPDERSLISASGSMP